MKAIATLIFIIFIATAAQAKDAKTEVKVETISMGIVTETNATTSKKENAVARLYRDKNYLVKKELSFTTKNNRAKLA